MTASQRRTVTVLVTTLAVAFLLVWATTSGPGRVIGAEHPKSLTHDVVQTPSSQVDSDTADPATQTHDQRPTTHSLGSWVQDVAAFMLLVAGLLVGVLLLRHLFFRIRLELTDERLVVPLEPLPDLEAARAAVQDAALRQHEALGASDVRNGIVACWVIFEEAAAGAHVQRQPAETASDFVVRFLHTLDVDPRPVGELAQLYLEARFSSHPLAPGTRVRAERALTAIHRELAHTGAAS